MSAPSTHPLYRRTQGARLFSRFASPAPGKLGRKAVINYHLFLESDLQNERPFMSGCECKPDRAQPPNGGGSMVRPDRKILAIAAAMFICIPAHGQPPQATTPPAPSPVWTGN